MANLPPAAKAGFAACHRGRGRRGQGGPGQGGGVKFKLLFQKSISLIKTIRGTWVARDLDCDYGSGVGGEEGVSNCRQLGSFVTGFEGTFVKSFFASWSILPLPFRPRAAPGRIPP